MMCLPQEFRLPEKYNYETAIDMCLKAIEHAKRVAGEAAVFVGINLLVLKEHEGHGNWLRALERIDLSPDKAERLIKLGRAFGENPQIINGLSQRKALQAASFIEDNLLQLRKDQVFFDPDGNTFTMQDIRESVEKSLVNLRNQKNGEIREVRDKLDNLQAEMKSMEAEYKRQAELNEQLMKDANAAMLAQMKARERLLEEKDRELNELREMTMEQQDEKVTGEAALGAIAEYRGCVIQAVSLLNTVKLVRDQQLRAEYYGAITWARELLKSLEERGHAYFGPNIEIDSKDVTENTRLPFLESAKRGISFGEIDPKSIPQE